MPALRPKFFSKRFPLDNKLLIAGGLTVGAILLTMLQDLLHAHFNNYTFYWAESLLYKSFWLVFFPLVLLLLQARAGGRRMPIFVSIFVVLALSIVHLALFAILVFIISDGFYDYSFSFLRTLRYAFAEYWYICILIYGVLLFIPFRERRQKEKTDQEEPETKALLQTIVLKKGTQYLSVDTKDVLYIQAASPYISIHTVSTKYLHNDTLKAIMEKLDPQQFVRIHKSTILNLQYLDTYTSRLNGDYDVLLQNGESLRLSRNYVKAFRAKMDLPSTY